MKFKQTSRRLRFTIDEKLTKMLKTYHDDDTCWARFNDFELVEDKEETYKVSLTYRIFGNVRNINAEIGMYDTDYKALLTSFMYVENDINKNQD